MGYPRSMIAAAHEDMVREGWSRPSTSAERTSASGWTATSPRSPSTGWRITPIRVSSTRRAAPTGPARATTERPWSLRKRSEYERSYWLLEGGDRVGTIAVSSGILPSNGFRPDRELLCLSHPPPSRRGAPRARGSERGAGAPRARPPPGDELDVAADRALLPPRRAVDSTCGSETSHLLLGSRHARAPHQRQRSRSDLSVPHRDGGSCWRARSKGRHADPRRSSPEPANTTRRLATNTPLPITRPTAMPSRRARVPQPSGAET